MIIKGLELREIRKEEVKEEDYIYIASENELFKLYKFANGYNCSNIEDGKWSESENENVSLEEHLNGWEETWKRESGVKFYTERKMKRIDKIRNMNIDELTKLLTNLATEGFSCNDCYSRCNGDCAESMKYYLNQEVDE